MIGKNHFFLAGAAYAETNGSQVTLSLWAGVFESLIEERTLQSNLFYELSYMAPWRPPAFERGVNLVKSVGLLLPLSTPQVLH